jgi:hypothetical protein
MWINPREIAGNRIEDDGNGYTDDVYGFDFVNRDGSVYDGTSDDHGTHVAGIVGKLCVYMHVYVCGCMGAKQQQQGLCCEALWRSLCENTATNMDCCSGCSSSSGSSVVSSKSWYGRPYA